MMIKNEGLKTLKNYTNGEMLLMAVSSYYTFKLTKIEHNKEIIIDKKKSTESEKVCTMLEPFLNKKNILYSALKPALQNTESQKDFNSTKLFDFKDICIESINDHLSIYESWLKDSEDYKESIEKMSKEINKKPNTKQNQKNIKQYTKITNQLNTMKNIFLNADIPADLNSLELYNKPL